jgi:hypothetical protein
MSMVAESIMGRGCGESMVNSSAYFDHLILSCSIIRNKGVIPSLIEFRNQLEINIQGLVDELKNKHYSETLIDAFCRLTCLVLDANIDNTLTAANMHWRGYELISVFYGLHGSEHFTSEHEELLICTKNSEISYYAKVLFSMSPQPKINKGLSNTLFKNDNNTVYKKLENLDDNSVLLKNYSPPIPIIPKSYIDPKFTKGVAIQLAILISILIFFWLIGYCLYQGEYL